VVLQPLMAIVFVFRDGRSLNRELIAAGFAWWFRKYSTDRSLEVLEQSARRERHGLWVGRGPMPPWDFRVNNQRRQLNGEILPREANQVATRPSFL
jgi:endonuclease YncB( thermonuclease family)